MKRLIAFPKAGAYTSPLYEVLSKKGVEVLSGQWSLSWLLSQCRRGDTIHIHWPSFIYQANGKSTVKALVGLIKYSFSLILLRLKGVVIFWTAHNLLPHERCESAWIDFWARKLTIWLSGTIFVHGRNAQKVLNSNFPSSRTKCVSIPHGHWIDYYGPKVDKRSAQERLNLPEDKFTLLMFGQLRPYKNIRFLMDSISVAEHSDVQLLIAGKFKESDYEAQISEAAEKNPNIRLDARFISDEEVPTYLAASDLMLMPYSEILTSGTAMLAISYGLPVASIKAGFLLDVITEETGLFLEEISQAELIRVINQAQSMDWAAEAILTHAKTFSFDEAGQQTYQALIGDHYSKKP
ncbi:glycosyltransferase [Neiella marina]|uniref:Glycosyltransferase n=1 Tax=Neiella holothuriorum TaxID=2870530 RepID=A0ABS7EGZ4_9GAMM|nr:glycosyltransferase [Neiella holothuriorum]MBW8191613.1 glycosyltransferase [Neiella holothuriorum]